MHLSPKPPGAGAFERLIYPLSIFTMIMTVPQVLAVWINREAGGVSLISWSAYLLASIVWFFYGLRKRDPRIYLACIGWIILNAAVVVGVLLFR